MSHNLNRGERNAMYGWNRSWMRIVSRYRRSLQQMWLHLWLGPQSNRNLDRNINRNSDLGMGSGLGRGMGGRGMGMRRGYCRGMGRGMGFCRFMRTTANNANDNAAFQDRLPSTRKRP